MCTTILRTTGGKTRSVKRPQTTYFARSRTIYAERDETKRAYSGSFPSNEQKTKVHRNVYSFGGSGHSLHDLMEENVRGFSGWIIWIADPFHISLIEILVVLHGLHVSACYGFFKYEHVLSCSAKNLEMLANQKTETEHVNSHCQHK